MQRSHGWGVFFSKVSGLPWFASGTSDLPGARLGTRGEKVEGGRCGSKNHKLFYVATIGKFTEIASTPSTFHPFQTPQPWKQRRAGPDSATPHAPKPPVLMFRAKGLAKATCF